MADPHPMPRGGLTSGRARPLARRAAFLALATFTEHLALENGACLGPPALPAEPVPSCGLLGTKAALLSGAGFAPSARRDRTPPLSRRHAHVVFLWFPSPETHALLAKKDDLLKECLTGMNSHWWEGPCPLESGGGAVVSRVSCHRPEMIVTVQPSPLCTACIPSLSPIPTSRSPSCTLVLESCVLHTLGNSSANPCLRSRVITEGAAFSCWSCGFPFALLFSHEDGGARPFPRPWGWGVSGSLGESSCPETLEDEARPSRDLL